MAAQTIVIVECYSSAVNYIHDVRVMGYEPVLLELFVPESEREENRKLSDRAYAFNGDPRPRVLMESTDYAETLRLVRELNPVLILPGSDPGLELAMRLSEDLGLKSNPLSIFPNLRDKLTMQETLQEAGIRSIRSRAVSSEQEALAFYREMEGRSVILKISRSAGSKGVYLCDSGAAVKRAYRRNAEFLRQRGQKDEKLIIQEYIDGEEYVVDTVSCEGSHAALFGMRYRKRLCEGYGKIYDTDFYLSMDDPSVGELVDYCFRVLTCLGIQYGPVHSEFMVDEKGPVLIEVNARPAGSFQRYTFQDKVMENHETAAALDSYLMSRTEFFARYPERMHLKQYAVVKQLCLEEDIFVEKVKITERLSALESFEYAIENGEDCIYPKTTDLDTNGGMIYLTSPDRNIVERDLNTILRLEKEGLQELFDWHRP